jgi:micrococcal nuclease
MCTVCSEPMPVTRFVALLCAGVLMFGGCQASPAPTTGQAPTGPTREALVVRVVDGDTIVVRLGGEDRRLRYIGMDAPETVRPDHPVEWMGPEASEANRRLVEGRSVVLEKDVSETDRFGRLLRHVWLRDGDEWLLVNLELVRLGYAQVTTFPPDVKYVELLLDAEREARDAERGLWADGPDQ